MWSCYICRILSCLLLMQACADLRDISMPVVHMVLQQHCSLCVCVFACFCVYLCACVCGVYNQGHLVSAEYKNSFQPLMCHLFWILTKNGTFFFLLWNHLRQCRQCVQFINNSPIKGPYRTFWIESEDANQLWRCYEHLSEILLHCAHLGIRSLVSHTAGQKRRSTDYIIWGRTSIGWFHDCGMLSSALFISSCTSKENVCIYF